MKNLIQAGLTIDHTPTAARASGAVTLIGTKIGVAAADVAANTPGVFYVEGVFKVPAKSTDTPAQGAALYWDNSARELTTTASGNTYAGYAYEAKASGVTSIAIKINE